MQFDYPNCLIMIFLQLVYLSLDLVKVFSLWFISLLICYLLFFFPLLYFCDRNWVICPVKQTHILIVFSWCCLMCSSLYISWKLLVRSRVLIRLRAVVWQEQFMGGTVYILLHHIRRWMSGCLSVTVGLFKVFRWCQHGSFIINFSIKLLCNVLTSHWWSECLPPLFN